METLQPEHEQSFNQAEELAKLDTFSRQDAEFAARNILQTLGSPTNHEGRDQRRAEVVEWFVENPIATEGEKKLAGLMLDAKYHADLQRVLDRNRESSSELSKAEAIQAVQAQNEFAGRVKHWVEANPEAASKAKLIEWLGRAAGTEKWSEKVVNGISGEIALKRELGRQGWEVRESSVREDVHGKMDVVASRGELTVAIDAKTRKNLEPHEVFKVKGKGRLDNGQPVSRYEIGMSWDEVDDNFNLAPGSVSFDKLAPSSAA